jgi:hypothetical protein
MEVDDLVRSGSKAELLECVAEYWNPDMTAFRVGAGIDLVIDRRDGYLLDHGHVDRRPGSRSARTPGHPDNPETLTTPHRSRY